MSRRHWRERAIDIQEAAQEIKDFTAGMSFEQFLADKRTAKAVLANLIFIGEAANHLPDDITRLLPHIEWPLIRRMRNIMVHAYFGIDYQIVWRTIQQDVDPLVRALRSLPSDIPPEQP